MNQTAQTLKYVVAAVVMVVLAAGTHFMTQPTPLEGYGKVGESFFPDLDPSEATALRLISYNEDTATVRDFSVQKKDGVWTLPSYYNYPADGEDQLANTSTSLLGIKRGALVSRSPKDHERFGVIDPLSEEESSLKGRGQRLIIFKENDIASADLIIGKEVPDRSGEHYVRVKDETETWICSLDVELSTKFSDWVEDDLLKMERDDLTKLEATSTVVDPQTGVSQKQEGVLTREKSADDWALAGINDESEEVNTDDIRTMVNTLDNLKLTGIRRRPRSPISGVDGPLLLNDLTFNVPEQLRNNPDVDRQLEAAVQAELSENGFLMYRDPQSGNRRLLSQGGELIAATNEGVEYHLHFGSSFTGTDEEIEIGKQSSDGEAESEASSDDESSDSDEETSEESEDGDTDDDEPETTESRYLFVRAVFNESLLGEKPTEPVKPDVPEGVEVDDNGDVVETETEESKEAADDAKEKAESTDDKDGEEKVEEAPKLTPAEIYKKEIAQYRKDVKTYESDLKGFEQKVKDGQEAVDVLNERFADWYYVISAEDFDKLALSRSQLVKEKEKEATDSDTSDEAASEAAADSPAAPTPEKPAPADAAKSDAAKEASPAEAKPEAPAEKPADPAKTDDSKAGGDDSAAKPAADPAKKEDGSGDSQ